MIPFPGRRRRRPPGSVGVRLAFLVLAVLPACGDATGPSGDDEPAPETVRLVAVGDFGTGGEAARAVAASIRERVSERPIDGFVTVGDNVYPGVDLDAAWDEPYGWVTASGIPVLAALGNGDYLVGAPEVMERLGVPGPWYRHRVGPVELFVLETVRGRWDEQRAWLARRLAASEARWKVAVLHDPPYSCAPEAGMEAVRTEWVPLFERHGVRLVLSGNHHSYQRFEPVRGVTYVVTGGGGAELHAVQAGNCPPEVPPLAAHASLVYHFLEIEASSAELRVRASSGGAVLDSFVLRP